MVTRPVAIVSRAPTPTTTCLPRQPPPGCPTQQSRIQADTAERDLLVEGGVEEVAVGADVVLPAAPAPSLLSPLLSHTPPLLHQHHNAPTTRRGTRGIAGREVKGRGKRREEEGGLTCSRSRSGAPRSGWRRRSRLACTPARPRTRRGTPPPSTRTPPCPHTHVHARVLPRDPAT